MQHAASDCRAYPGLCFCDVLLQVQWSTYFIAVCFFHISEFIVVAKFHPDDVTFGCE